MASRLIARRKVALLSLLGAAVVAAPTAASPQRDALVRPGFGIGKVRLEMTFAHVRRALGAPQWVNRRRHLGFGRTYVEYAWDYGLSVVGFEGRAGELRVALVATGLRTERTREGVGIGSLLRTVVRTFPSATCRDVAFPSRYHRAVIVPAVGNRVTVFSIWYGGKATPHPGRVVEVTVMGSIRFGLERSKPCRPGWRRT